MSRPEASLPEEEQGRAIAAFDGAVDQLGEDAAFLSLEGRPQAARYLAHAHAVLVEVRMGMHRLQASADEPGFRRRASRRMRTLAADIAQAGIRDARSVQETARRLAAAPPPQTGDRPSGWGDALRTRTARATAWSVERWTGSPLPLSSLQSPRAVETADSTAELVRRREEQRLRRATRPRRATLVTGIVIAGTGTLALAGYGGWTLLTLLFGG
ncbi:type VI protein secretion system component VasF [Microbacterium resistens]|uniref:Type VI protein secretion system component VasF n=1 Tax=Microbacterium resistens TaxID=156977 RepID=A0ABU1S915_9MICO|nr:hypothetical protein [Microbacterium resistens]MDR6866099.1 type VI protein secretion system component VasF [Microbacterium resistens]